MTYLKRTHHVSLATGDYRKEDIEEKLRIVPQNMEIADEQVRRTFQFLNALGSVRGPSSEQLRRGRI